MKEKTGKGTPTPAQAGWAKKGNYGECAVKCFLKIWRQKEMNKGHKYIYFCTQNKTITFS